LILSCKPKLLYNISTNTGQKLDFIPSKYP